MGTRHAYLSDSVREKPSLRRATGRLAWVLEVDGETVVRSPEVVDDEERGLLGGEEGLPVSPPPPSDISMSEFRRDRIWGWCVM